MKAISQSIEMIRYHSLRADAAKREDFVSNIKSKAFIKDLSITFDAATAKGLLRNSLISKKELVHLVKLDDNAVRVLVLSHPKCPKNLLLKYASNPNHLIRKAIAERPILPRKVAKILRRDSVAEIRDLATTASLRPKK